jgi:indolepyruvate ferredoxin oxidoreductase, beta subunit
MAMETDRQQLVIGGVGGQGVLFVTRLLAEAAVAAGLPVFASETHGMAQRGGTVVSHLKVGAFASPLVRPGCADGLVALAAEGLAAHGPFLRDGGWRVVNAAGEIPPVSGPTTTVDAAALAAELGNPRAVNLVVLGAALAAGRLFCSLDAVRDAARFRLGDRPRFLEPALEALAAGASAVRS